MDKFVIRTPRDEKIKSKNKEDKIYKQAKLENLKASKAYQVFIDVQ